jgi:hypothetical protein
MGWGGYLIEIGLMLDEHAGEKERYHTELAAKLLLEIRLIAESPTYQEIVTRVDSTLEES